MLFNALSKLSCRIPDHRRAMFWRGLVLWLGAGISFAATAAAIAQSEPLGLAYQLTHSYNLDNSLSPDGDKMVLIRVVGGREQLFVMKSDGRGEVQITHDDADHEDPAWSPDGRKIAYVRIAEGSKRLATVNIDGSDRMLLTPEDQGVLHPSWTPDGRHILYCTDDDLRPPDKNDANIYSIDVESGRVRTIITGGVNTFPVMSPDGARIAFRKMVGNNSEVFVADSDGGNQRNLTNHPAFEGWPAWSPDGAQIAFAGNRNSSYQIFLMDADGGDVRLLANTEGRGTAPKWAPDGRKIYFTLCRNVDFGRGCEIMIAPIPESN